MITAIAILLITLLQMAFFSVTYYGNPTDWFAAYYILWMIVPSTVAALAFAPRYHFIAAMSNAIISALMFDYLFLQLGYFWPERPKEAPFLAFAYVVFGVWLAFIMAGFIHASINGVQQQPASRKTDRIWLAMRKGLAFSIVCAAVAFPLLIMLGPMPLPLALIVAVFMILTGTIIGMVVGLTYVPTAPNIKTARK